MAISAEVLKILTFDPDTFETQIAEIHVYKDNSLVFTFHDERKVEQVWQDKSRRNSWDDAMRQEARTRQLEITKRRNAE